MWHVILPILLFLTSIFLILLVLIQRGRGGGLAGAFGGMGGQSAFGTKAGDLFTRVTIGVATFWILLCAASVKLLSDSGTSLISPTLGSDAAAPQQPGGGPATGSSTQSPAAGGQSAPATTESTAPAADASAPAADTSAPTEETSPETPE